MFSQLNTTSKPLRLRGRSGSPKLITSDLNNEMKFRFLSQTTKPDYRSIDEREDCEEIIKLIEVKQKVQEGRVSRPRSDLSRRSDESMLSLATCGTAPIVAAESVDDLDTEVSILNGNLRDDGSGSDTARSLDEGHRLLENTVTMLERQLRRSDNRILELERLCELQQGNKAMMANEDSDDENKEKESDEGVMMAERRN
ncbi:unnamed protein product [Nippostrongylus brasiliensis]|uniref:PRKC apoptosis WT1 regulator protein n=1 Tax=Nippostrongylus brasiliensis TaxID=27835 RepID=A0A0N4YLV9_NIPBR|nr:unnamed protein product [Nippostrongylus brasiliensis]